MDHVAQPDGGTGVVVVVSTAPDEATARRIAGTLLEERLIACANLVPGVRSLYRWQGAVHDDAEVLMFMKAPHSGLQRLQQRLPALHPYEVPELLVLPVTAGLAPYCHWVIAETEGASA